MRTLMVIPARYASTRFPGKPLARLGGKAVLQWVWETVSQVAAESGAEAVVATDDGRIAESAARGFGARVMLTSEACQSGTDRCGEVLQRMREEQGARFDTVVNVQGDEPFVEAEQLRTLMAAFAAPAVQIATLRTPILTTEELLSPNNVKVVCAESGDALYFSRQPLPYRRDAAAEQWLELGRYYKHVGIYAYRAQTLEALCQLPVGQLEASERLEQLRWLAAGYAIRTLDTPHANIGIDTPADLAAAESYLAAHPIHHFQA
ncbi:MAG: 3-deoxy-manno-octulosonate cytidylyltransferase [Bacteroidales bacterium]|nr:3-deoxy-manno-octulosonate cytidylyltransferase [Bacteroidales bacterium]